MVNTSFQSNLRSIAAVICKTAFVLGLLVLFMASPAQAQNYGPEQSICWNNWGNFDRIRVRFEATNRNSDYDTNILVNGQTIASVGRDPWGGNSYSGETYVYKPISINLGWQFVGGPWWGGFNGRIDYGCNPTFEDSGISPVEGTFYFYGSYLVKSNIGITKSATPTSLKAGASGQFYTINVNITNAATTAPTYIYDNLPAGISTAGAITISRGSILGCPAAGATSLSGCYIPTGASGTFSINVPINIANNTASTVTNTAYAYNTGSANCTTTTSCPGSSTNPVAPNSASFFVQQAIYYNVKSPGPWTFSYSGTNGVGSPTLTNTVVDWAGAVNSPTYTLGALGANTVLNVPSSPGWYVSWASCSDLNAATTGNPTGNLAVGSGSTWGTYVLTIPAANVRGGSAFQCQVVYSASAVRLITKLAGPRINDSDQFVVKVTDANVNDITSTTSGTGSTVTGGDTGWRTYNWGSHTIQQTMAPGSTSALSNYNSTVSCTNAQVGGTNVSGVTKIGDSFTSGDPDIITCTITNTPKPKLYIQQAIYYTVKSPGPWTFSYSGTNGVGSPTLTNTVVDWAGAVNSPTYTLGALGANTVLNVPSSPGWYVSWASCSDLNAATTGNPTGNLAVGSGSTWGTYVLTIPAANVRGGSAFQCQVVYSASAVRLITKLAGPRINDSDQFVVKVTDANVNDITSTTSGTGSTVTGGDTGWRTYNWGSHTIQQTMAPGSTSALSNYNSTVSCTNAQVGGTNVSGVTKIGDSFTSGDPDIITCTITNSPKAPMLRLNKALGSSGRVASTDQFALAIKTGGVGGTTVASATTTGTSLLPTESATLAEAAPGTTYTLVESAAGSTRLNQYTSTLTCTDASGVQTGLPKGQAYNPSVGATITPVLGANISCTITNSPKDFAIYVTKQLGGNRINAADQFNVQVLNGGNGFVIATGITTAGSGAVVNSGTGVLSFSSGGCSGCFHSIGEAMAPGSVTPLSLYTPTVSCSNATVGGTDVSGVKTINALYGFSPVYGDSISCTITNTPKAPVLTLRKALGSDRANAADQFTVQIKNGATVVKSADTSGTGSQVSGGTTGVTTLAAGTTYTLTEVPLAGGTTNLAQYTSTLSCVNALAGSTTVLPTTVGGTLTPGVGDDISCTITNTAKAPVLRLNKALGTGGRISPSDQFVIEIYNEFGQLMATQTTTGTGDQALGQAQATAVAGVRYMVGEKMAAGSASNVEQYSYPVSCTNALSVTNGGTDMSSVTSQGALFGPLRAGDDITCTITNTAKQPRLTVQKRLGASGRIDPADQFRLEVFRETGGALVGGVTTTGNTTTPNEQVQVVGVIGERYMIGEKMAPGSVSNVEQYSYPLSCTNSFSTANGGSDVSGVTSQGALFGPLRAGDNISCVITNTAKRASLFLTQSLNDAIHRYPIVVRYAANNGWTTTQLSSSVNTEITSAVQNLNATGVAMQFNLTMPNVFWRISSVACTDANASLTGNPTRSFGTVLSTTSFSLNAENVRAGSQLKCALLLAAPPPF